jgi:hypothetical protein
MGCGVVYVAILIIAGIGRPPLDQPVLLQIYMLCITLVGLYGLVAIAWTASVIFVFMSIGVTSLSIQIILTRSSDNLGLQPYGSFIVAITVRIFVALTIGGLATITVPSPFIMSIFAFVSVTMIIWFIGTQYGLHRLIMDAKQRFINQIESQYYEGNTGEMPTNKQRESSDTNQAPTIEVQEIQAVITVKRQIDVLPNWPVNTRNILSLSGSIFASLISILGQPVQNLLLEILKF